MVKLKRMMGWGKPLGMAPCMSLHMEGQVEVAFSPIVAGYGAVLLQASSGN